MMTLTPQHGGWIEIICGPMFSGKTEELIRRLVRAQIAMQNVKIYKPVIDNRYSAEDIVSHNNRVIKSQPVEQAEDILKHMTEADVIGIDEAQFFSADIVSVARQLANSGKRVVIAGLEKDYLGQPFGPMPELLVEADYISKVLAICVRCGEPANFSQRLTADSAQVLVGEGDKYEARCRNCFNPHESDG